MKSKFLPALAILVGTAVGAGTPVINYCRKSLTASESITLGKAVSLNAGQVRHTRFSAGTASSNSYASLLSTGYGITLACDTNTFIQVCQN